MSGIEILVKIGRSGIANEARAHDPLAHRWISSTAAASESVLLQVRKGTGGRGNEMVQYRSCKSI